MRAVLRARLAPFSLRRAIGLSLLLHVIVFGWLRPETYHPDVAYAGPLSVQLRPPPLRRPPVAVAPKTVGRMPPPSPRSEPSAPRSRQLAVPAAGTLAVVDAPPVLQTSEDPEQSPPTASVASSPHRLAVQAATDMTKEAPRVTQPGFAASYLHNPKPPFPISARRNGEAGTVILNVLVTREGVAGRVQLETSSGSDALDRSALETVKRWRFTLATRDNDPVEAWVRVPIVFRLEDR